MPMLTPFLDTYPGSVKCRQDRVAILGLQEELPMRMVADEGITDYD